MYQFCRLSRTHLIHKTHQFSYYSDEYQTFPSQPQMVLRTQFWASPVPTCAWWPGAFLGLCSSWPWSASLFSIPAWALLHWLQSLGCRSRLSDLRVSRSALWCLPCATCAELVLFQMLRWKINSEWGCDGGGV